MSDCECAARLAALEERLEAIEAERTGRDYASTTSSSTAIAHRGRAFGFVRNDIKQGPLDVKA